MINVELTMRERERKTPIELTVEHAYSHSTVGKDLERNQCTNGRSMLINLPQKTTFSVLLKEKSSYRCAFSPLLFFSLLHIFYKQISLNAYYCLKKIRYYASLYILLLSLCLSFFSNQRRPISTYSRHA